MKTTPLHAAHKSLNAKMGEFAGYDMPLYYEMGVMAEHEWVRAHAGLFDVSHMGQIVLEGPGVISFLEKITPSSFAPLPPGRAKYTVMTNENGGIVDDLIITRLGEERFFAVINAGCKDKDLAWIERHLPDDVTLTRLDGRALLALQGPEAEKTLKAVLGVDASDMPYMWMTENRTWNGIKLHISRVGYTGEDGFELSVPANAAEKVWNALCANSAVKPIGLAARDSLRLEMGYCLYGHDIDDKTTPVEAGLSWVIGRENTGFIGSGIVRAQMEDGAPRKRVGIRLLDKGIAREGAIIRYMQDEMGILTSGGFSPTLKQAIGIAYIETPFADVGTVAVIVRDRAIPAEICPMPFVPAKTKSMKKQAA